MNKAQAIMYLYPEANPLRDFEVRDICDGNGPYIAVWNLDVPQPTEEELQAAWEAYQKAEADKPLAEPDELEQLRKELADSKTALEGTNGKLKAAGEETTNVQLALAEMYEQLLALKEGNPNG
ncbi:XkdW family protein [Paenibacillus zanthoxyli]|uniref:XkdW family protein n=1 Tax=Paenibacillus zanthoxyli TaxID=369399 RepID=UPI000470708D|nr:XkdW family protein [Paenibacillus zanthoxyli]